MWGCNNQSDFAKAGDKPMKLRVCYTPPNLTKFESKATRQQEVIQSLEAFCFPKRLLQASLAKTKHSKANLMAKSILYWKEKTIWELELAKLKLHDCSCCGKKRGPTRLTACGTKVEFFL